MSEIKVTNTTIWEVDIIESERGWGSKVDETKYFTDKQSATEFVVKYNAKNDQTYVPDWYMYAENPISKIVKTPNTEQTYVESLLQQIGKLPARCGRIKRSDVINILKGE